ncbi:MAG: hypothetical protein SFV54_00530 [Bryobacteraceae bacterium]|nr:hypothetical protein [Bryobacteraceae bacterium]
MMRAVLPYVVVVVVCLAMPLVFQPHSGGDTAVYAADIFRADERVGGVSRLWEFGHLLWRPLGLVTWRLLPLGEGEGGIVRALLLLNLLSMAGAGCMAAALARQCGVGARGSLLLALLLLLLNPVLNYGLTGNAYVPGLFAQLAAAWFLLRMGERTDWRAVTGAGLCLAASVLLWFPYVLTSLGLVALGRLRGRSWAGPAAALVLAGAATVGVYGVVAVANDFATPEKFMAWFRDASHGWDQNKKLLRLPNGFARAFISLGNDGLLIKRFLLRDPYAPVSPAQLVSGGLWKIPMMAMLFAALLWALPRHTWARPLGMALTLAWVPLLLFSVVLFEPGSPERMMPAFAPTLVAGAAVASKWDRRRAAERVLAAGWLVVVLVNVWTYRKIGDPVRGAAETRIAAIAPKLTAHSRVVLISTTNDEIATYYGRYVLVSASGRLPVYHLVEINLRQKGTWRTRFADVATATWAKGGDVWVSRRLWRARPEPQWNWAEGDDPTVRWRDFPAYFGRLEVEDEAGGEDGFVRLKKSDANQAVIALGQ